MREFSKRNIDKFYEETELINSPYYRSNEATSIVVASDLHYHPHVDKEIFKLLIKYIRDTKPDFIIMPGDQIETIDFIDNIKEKEFFENMIKSLAEIAPVIIIPGNHEVGNFVSDSFFNQNFTFNARAISYFESLTRFKNVYFLNNEQIRIGDIMFLGFSPRLSTYLKHNDERTNNMFMEDYIKSGLRMSDDDYNILLAHNPILFGDDNIINAINDFQRTDLVISGHLHDGYMPKALDRYLGKTNAGLFFTPRIMPYPGIRCRGIHDFGRGYIFISQGFRKWSADIPIFNIFERFCANDVEQLIISNQNSGNQGYQKKKIFKQP